MELAVQRAEFFVDSNNNENWHWWELANFCPNDDGTTKGGVILNDLDILAEPSVVCDFLALMFLAG